MPRRSSTDRLNFLRQQRDQLDARLRALEARQRVAARKVDTRRKVIAGALALEHMQRNPASELATVLRRLLDEYVTRPADRMLFPSLSPPVPAETPTPTPPRAREFAGAAAEINRASQS